MTTAKGIPGVYTHKTLGIPNILLPNTIKHQTWKTLQGEIICYRVFSGSSLITPSGQSIVQIGILISVVAQYRNWDQSSVLFIGVFSIEQLHFKQLPEYDNFKLSCFSVSLDHNYSHYLCHSFSTGISLIMVAVLSLKCLK